MSDGVFFFEEEPHNLAPRLFRLQPEGDGGGRESLATYVKRLAHMHRMAPRGFVEEYISPRGSNNDSVALQRDWLYRNGQDLIGVSERASAMADWLERNTGVAGLRWCTLTGLSGFACGQKLITRSTRVCLQCLDEDTREGRPMYERLLWRLEPVTACDKHACTLIAPRCERHPASSRAVPPSLPGVCTHCGSIGFKCMVDHDDARCSETDVWIAEQCRRLIAALPSISEADPVRMKMNLRAHWVAGSGIVSAAKEIGVVQSSLSAWLRSPRAKCSLYRLVDIALTQQLDLVALLRGDLTPCVGPMDRGPRMQKRVIRKVDHAAVERRLLRALEVGENAAQVAREMNVSLFTLSLHKKLYRQVCDRARAARESKDSLRRRDAVREAEEMAIRLLQQHKAPSLRNASIESGVKWLPSGLKSAALASIRVRLGHPGIRDPARAGGYSVELRRMLDESAERIRQQFE
jgi:hypothetical protein